MMVGGVVMALREDAERSRFGDVVYIFGFAVSWSRVVWLVCSEIFPLEGREVGMTIATMVNWTFAGLVMVVGEQPRLVGAIQYRMASVRKALSPGARTNRGSGLA